MSTTQELEYDIVVGGGGTAGPMAAIKAKEANPDLRVLLIDKANVRRSGCISMGMDGLNNAIIPGHATPRHATPRHATPRRSSTPARSPSPTTASSTRRPSGW